MVVPIYFRSNYLRSYAVLLPPRVRPGLLGEGCRLNELSHRVSRDAHSGWVGEQVAIADQSSVGDMAIAGSRGPRGPV
jgi:hypothetical protein